MNQLQEMQIDCPYCGETIKVLIDPQETGSSYIEDCQVCCSPIVFMVSENEEGLEVSVFSQDEV